MIKLRAIERSDLIIMKIWRNQGDVMPYCREYRYLSDEDQSNWYESYLKSRRSSDWDQEFMMGTHDNFVGPIGICGFTRMQWRNRRAEISFYIGNTTARTGANIIYILHELVSIGFNEFGLHKLTWPVYEHDPNLYIYERIFKKEAELVDEYFWDNRWYKRIYLSLINDKG